jgi:hypothetical protein
MRDGKQVQVEDELTKKLVDGVLILLDRRQMIVDCLIKECLKDETGKNFR